MNDRTPPYSQTGEQGVLGCLLLDPNATMPIALEKLNRNIEPFYDARHQSLFDLLVEMYDGLKLIDPLTIEQALKDRNQLEPLGGMAYMVSLMNSVPSAASLEYYIEMVNEKAYQRRAVQVCTRVITQIYDGELNGDSLNDELETRIMELTRKTTKRGTRKESLMRVVGMLEDMHNGREIPGLLKTGFPDLDKCLGGLFPGDQIVIAARPGLGKSTLAMNIAEHNAIDCGNPVGYFSLEMSEDKLNMRSLASRTGIDLSIYKDSGRSVDYATHRINTTLPTLLKAKIEIEFSPGISIMQLRAKARQMAHAVGIKLIIVDMLQLVTSRAQKRTQEVGEVSRGLKALAGELNVPVISISSMSIVKSGAVQTS